MISQIIQLGSFSVGVKKTKMKERALANTATLTPCSQSKFSKETICTRSLKRTIQLKTTRVFASDGFKPQQLLEQYITEKRAQQKSSTLAYMASFNL
jgi:hypothetical protein